MDWFMGKGRRKDKDSPTPPIGSGEDHSSKPYLEDSCLQQRVIHADLNKLVQLPPSLDTNEWLATHTISFFNHVNLMYGVVSEFCTSESCSSMVGPDNVQYHWQDEKGKKVKQSAPQYIDHMMSHIQKSVTDETQFPTKFGQEFPPGFPDTVRKIHRYLFHVLAHLYHAHTELLVSLGLQGHLNTLFVHFMLFSSHFSLLPPKEAEVLMDLHTALLKAMQEDPNQNTHSPEGSSSKEGSPHKERASSHGDQGSACPHSVCPAPSSEGQTASQCSPGCKGSGSSRSGSENGAAATGMGMKTAMVDIPSS